MPQTRTTREALIGKAWAKRASVRARDAAFLARNDPYLTPLEALIRGGLIPSGGSFVPGHTVEVIQEAEASPLGLAQKVGRFTAPVPTQYDDPEIVSAFQELLKRKNQLRAQADPIPEGRGLYGNVEAVVEGQHREVLKKLHRQRTEGLYFEGAPEVGPDFEDWDWEPTANPGAASTNAKTQELRDIVHYRLESRATAMPGDRLVGALSKLEKEAADGLIPKDPRALRTYVQEVLSQPDAAMISGPALKKAAPRLFDAWWWGVADNIKKTGAGAMGHLPGDHSLVQKAWKAAKSGNPAAANAYNKAFFYSTKGRTWEDGVQKELARARLFQSLDAKQFPIDRPEGTLSESLPGDRVWKDRLADAGRTAKVVKDEEYAPLGRWVKGAKPANTLLPRMQVEKEIQKGGGLNDLQRRVAGKYGPRPDRITSPIKLRGARDVPDVDFMRSGAPRQTLKPGWEGVLKKAAVKGDREADALLGMLKGLGGKKSVKGLEVFLGPQRMTQLMKIVNLLK